MLGSIEVKCQAEVTLGNNLTFYALSFDPSSGRISDADAVPAYRIYENETGTAILTGSMAKLDDTNTTGFYSETVACTTANGFESGKSYAIYVTATVDGNATGSATGLTIIPGYSIGPGDYSVTLTIRTTGGTAISGVSVWLNTTSNRAGAVAGPKTTNDSGEVTFNLNYTTYYVYCHLSGYTFANATITPAAGSLTFTKDIGTASVAGGSSGYSDSFLTRAIAKVRQWIDEPSINAKYTDTELLEQLEFSYIHVVSEKNRNATTPVVAKVTITVASGTTDYVLPYTIGSVIAIYSSETYGSKLFYSSRSQYNPFGKRIWVEGNVLKIQADGFLGASTEIIVEYIPTGTSRLHHGTCTINAAGTAVTLGATPNVGTLDTHHEAYTGSVLRVLNVTGTTVTGNVQQERTITAYDNSTRIATVSPAISPVPTTDDGSIFYEIAPAIHKGLDLVVAIHAAYTICAMEGNRKRAGAVLTAYQEAIRNVRLQAYYSNEQECAQVRGDNFDNRFYSGYVNS